MTITASYITNKSFSVIGDQTNEFQVGRRVKLIGTTDFYGTISTSVYTTLTTITLTDESDIIDNTITEVLYGIISATDDTSSMPNHIHSGDGSGGSLSHVDLTNKGTNTHTQIDSHISSVLNPHQVTKAQVGLTNVEDGADVTSTHETSHSDVLVDGDFTSNGFMKRTGAGTYTVDTGTYEPVISTKKTAFNKDFGIVVDTVCQGNDTRLSDARTPVAHTQAASTITDFDTEVANNTAVTANTAKVTNATHTGEVTGSGALTITNKQTLTASNGVSISNSPTVIGTAAPAISLTYGTTANTVCVGNDARLSDSRTPVSHVHGNITNDGKIGTTATLPIITGTSGILQAGSFGTTSGTFCQGNDTRLSDARTPTSHDNTQHSATYITSSSVTYETLNTNGDVGTTSGTLAIGNHTHSYEPADATILKQSDVDDSPVDGVTTAPVSSNWAYDHNANTNAHHNRSHAITGSSDHTAGNHKVFYSNGSGVITELTLGEDGTFLKSNGVSAAPTFATASSGGVTDHGALTGLSDDDHSMYHNDSRGDARYEPIITVKNTAFNKSYGTTVDTVCQGNDSRLSDARTPVSHDNTYHSASYITTSGVTYEVLNTNGDVGTTSGTLAIGDHNHSSLYEPVNANIQSHISSTSNPHSTTAAQITLTTIGTPTINTLQESYNAIESAGVITGGLITDDGDGTITVGAGEGVIKTTDSDTGDNVIITWSSNSSLTLTDNNINYIYINYNSGTPIIQSSTSNNANGTTIFGLGMVFKEGTNLDIVNAGLRVSNLAKKLQQLYIEHEGIHIVSGATVSAVGTRQISITEGVMYFGFNRVITDAVNTSTGGTFEYYYYNGSSWVESDQTTINNTQYNNIATGLATLSNNKYGIHWVFKGTNGNMYVVYGQGDYTLLEAQAQGLPASLPLHVTTISCIVAKIIILKGATTFTELGNISTSQFSARTSPSNHNELGNIQGGAANDYYHLTSTNVTDLTDGGDSTLHYHSSDRITVSHTHGNITYAGYIGTTATLPIITGTNGILQAGSFGTAAGTFCVGNDSRLSDNRTPTSHGNESHNSTFITSSGVTYEALNTNGDVGTTASTLCAGNDSRLSDARTPVAHTQAASTITDFDTEVANNDAVTANTAKVTNATHTGDVTGSAALTIANKQTLTASNGVSISNSPTVIGSSAPAISLTYGTTANTVCVGNDSRLSDARTPVSHVHGNITNDGKIGTTTTLPIITGTDGILQAGSFGTIAGTFCQGNDSRLSDARTPVSHVHGNITNTGYIGTTATLPIITGTSGILQAGSFGTAAGTFCVGNDSRLSDARTPTTHTQAASTITDFDTEVANNTAVTANTAKVTNATHTGEVTGSTALTIADNIVDEANLKLDEGPTNNYVLTADSTKTGGMKWAAATSTGGLNNIVEDTTPQLGGALDANGNAIVAADHGTATTAQVVNVVYGTGAAPTASTTTEGTLYIKYTA